MAEHFLTKSRIDFSHCIKVAGAPAIDRFEDLHRLIAAKAGADSAKLFGEPLISRGNDQAAASVSWYSDHPGQGTPVAKLSSDAATELQNTLSQRLAPIEALIDDPEIGELVSAALYISSGSDIWSVDGQPVLINWGMLPEKALNDAGVRSQHYSETLGRFLPLAAAPPLNQSERTTRRNNLAVVAATAATAAAAAAAAATVAGAGDATSGDAGDDLAEATGTNSAARTGAPDHIQTTAAVAGVVHVKEHSRVPMLAWLPLLLLLLLVGAGLVWLLLPGNRIFARDSFQPVISDAAGLAAAAQVNRDLEQRLATLQGAYSGAVCRADGTLLMPNGVTIEGLLPPDLRDYLDIPGVAATGRADAVLPPDPDRVVVPGSGTDQVQDTASLLELIDTRTALVLARSNAGLSVGTGFFVGPDLLVTNFHVIAGVAPENILVTSKAMNGLKTVKLLKQVGPMETTGADFALLRVNGVNQPAFTLRQSPQSMRLQSVIAAGFPGDLLRSDAAFAALRAGDASAVPELIVTDGTVSTEQKTAENTNTLVHSAPISTGNSGGPLIDMCGRLVGVNTFVIKGPMRNLNFALATDDLLKFLAGTPANPKISTETCQPNIVRPVSPPPAVEN